MSTPLKYLLMLLAWLAYSLITFQFCGKQCCEVDGSAITDDQTQAEDDQTVENRYPIGSLWNDATGYEGPGYEELRAQLIGAYEDGKQLKITGLYYPTEPKPEGFENMGFARADAIKQLLIPDIPAEAIITRARTISGGDPDDKAQYFEGYSYEWIDAPTKADDDTAPEDDVEELDDRIVIKFDYSESNTQLSPQIQTYLDKLSEQLQAGSGNVRLVGHTDNKGAADFNQELGLRRAQFVRRYLINKGVNRSQISVDSRGETEPEDTNDTEAGRANNRRVEVYFDK